MKKHIIYMLLAMSSMLLLSGSLTSQAQPPMPPGAHGLNGNGSGGAAPVDGGSLILILSSLGYGALKVILGNKEKRH